MKTVGIICEYNPFHLGHKKQIDRIRSEFGLDTAVVCAMSGNYVQRGSPAIVDKSHRAKAAILSGADLVLELPVTVSLSSAEGFAAGGVRLLSRICDVLCFGAEDSDTSALLAAAQTLLSADFSSLLRRELDSGKSFPAARQAVLEHMGVTGRILSQPNNILAVEYCKAILSQGSSLIPFPIHREGCYHAEEADPRNPSATSLRSLMLRNQSWQPFVPTTAHSILMDSPLHAIQAGERAILAKLRTMTDMEFEALPYGSEGLWRKLMHASRSCVTLEEILTATKSKRYTRSRLDRMVMCAFLGITQEILAEEVPYARVLAFNERGRNVLKHAKKNTLLLNAGEPSDHPYWLLEKRCGDLYGLFCVNGIEPPGAEECRRIFYHQEAKEPSAP